MITQKINFLIIIITILLFANCNNESTIQNSKPLPNTPETVTKQWQLYLDNNELEKVATLSTATTKEWLTENKELFLSDTQVYKTEFVKMNCDSAGNRAACLYTIKEDGELIEDVFLLKKIDGQWLVDIEEDESTPMLDEQIFKEMKKELKLD